MDLLKAFEESRVLQIILDLFESYKYLGWLVLPFGIAFELLFLLFAPFEIVGKIKKGKFSLIDSSDYSLLLIHVLLPVIFWFVIFINFLGR